MAKSRARRWNDWRIEKSGRNIKSKAKSRQPGPGPWRGELEPTDKQLSYLKTLGYPEGESPPRTRKDASVEIERRKLRM